MIKSRLNIISCYFTQGVSLIELIMSMVIINIVFIALVMVFQMSFKIPTKKNIKLATTIANNYLNEIVSKNFPSNWPCPNNTNNLTRGNYTDLCNYHNLVDYGAKDLAGQLIPGLEKFTVYIKVDLASNVTLGDLSGSDNILNADIAKIEVTVSHPKISNIIISTFKGNY